MGFRVQRVAEACVNLSARQFRVQVALPVILLDVGALMIGIGSGAILCYDYHCIEIIREYDNKLFRALR